MTFIELRKQFEDVKNDWENRLKARQFERMFDSSKDTTGYQPEAEIWVTIYMDFHIYVRLVYNLEKVEREWQEKLFYLLTDEEKINMIKIRVEELKIYFKQNPSEILNPAFYLENLSAIGLPGFLFLTLNDSTKEKIWKEIKKNDFKENDYKEFDYFDEMRISSFVSKLLVDFNLLNTNIIEFIYLKVLIEEIISKTYRPTKYYHTESSDIEKNEYPEIFNFINSLNLFNYTILELNKKENIGPALANKLLEYFKDENKIIKKAKKTHFINFLREEHQLLFSKLDDRAVANEHDIQIFKNIEENFKIESSK
ncbi:hypothetical protein [Planktosalinus lacus]|uniref:Uncharacterized protein n=1 Tax=Planktosalinus lacus TaxID=1526573 RepID=A0A8J2VEF1_9FLAO|nr:hypothetical protein [Planktosalinus lacus]GGD99584.1 hypothetical protein GCM10011312_23810 [Planktosalinus lacus]